MTIQRTPDSTKMHRDVHRWHDALAALEGGSEEDRQFLNEMQDSVTSLSATMGGVAPLPSLANDGVTPFSTRLEQMCRTAAQGKVGKDNDEKLSIVALGVLISRVAVIAELVSRGDLLPLPFPEDRAVKPRTGLRM